MEREVVIYADDLTIEDFLDRDVPKKDDLKAYFFQDEALGYLLYEKVCFLNSRKYNKSWKEDEVDLSEDSTIVVFVNCNDVFAWAYADGEEVSFSEYVEEGKVNELYDLLRLHLENKKWGSIKWVCLKRNMKPQSPIVRDMKKEGYWDTELESLPENPIDARCCDHHRELAEQNKEEVSEETSSLST